MIIYSFMNSLPIIYEFEKNNIHCCTYDRFLSIFSEEVYRVASWMVRAYYDDQYPLSIHLPYASLSPFHGHALFSLMKIGYISQLISSNADDEFFNFHVRKQ